MVAVLTLLWLAQAPQMPPPASPPLVMWPSTPCTVGHGTTHYDALNEVSNLFSGRRMQDQCASIPAECYVCCDFRNCVGNFTCINLAPAQCQLGGSCATAENYNLMPVCCDPSPPSAPSIPLGCPDGFQCLPINSWQGDAMVENAMIETGYDGACIPCTQGQYCPGSTTNIDPPAAFANVCPSGKTCTTPDRQEPCPAGNFCPFATFQGGMPCSQDDLRRQLGLPRMEWSQGIYCREGSSLPLDGMLGFVCDQGGYCPNASHRIVCPKGHFCEHGVAQPTPCTSRLLGPSAEEKCPEGSSFEPAAGANFVYLLLAVVPALLLLESWSFLETRARKKRVDTETIAQQNYFRLGKRARRRSGLARMLQARSSSVLVGRFRSRSGGPPPSVPASPPSQDASWSSTPEPERSAPAAGTGSLALPLDIMHEQNPKSAHDPSLNELPQASPVETTLKRASAMLKRTTSFTSMPKMSSLRRQRSDDHSVLNSSNDVHREDEIKMINMMKMPKGRTLIRLEMHSVHFHIGSAGVLTDINTVLQQGDLIALMGESGSGKTTLLNVLGGRADYGWTQGEMILNGRPYHPRKMRHLLGYVPQAHLVFKELTVYENLAYAARLRLHPRLPRERLIDMALDLLGLKECAHFVCDPAIGERLSGGQMRRVGIGIELACDPVIMLLDEPTSALDAVNTRLIIMALKVIARRGKLVLASLHQPRQLVYETLDQLLLLRKGELIYGGLRRHAVPYFEQLGFPLPPNGNPADFFIEVAFGYEVSTKKHRDLAPCFGLRPAQVTELTWKFSDRHVKPHSGTVTWEFFSYHQPTRGSPLKNKGLAQALAQGQLDFDCHEWSAFNILNLHADHYIRADAGKNSEYAGFYRPVCRHLCWVAAGDMDPSQGVEIQNDDLSRKLSGGVLDFSQEEWRAFNIANVHYDNFIKTDSGLFRPKYQACSFVTSYRGKVVWRSLGGARPNGGHELINDSMEFKRALWGPRTALKGERIEFTPDNWMAFNIPNLRGDHFVNVDDAYFRPVCVSWVKVGDKVPSGGVELVNGALSKVLEAAADVQLEFTHEEWTEFNVSDLRFDHYVRASSGGYFRPTSGFNAMLFNVPAATMRPLENIICQRNKQPRSGLPRESTGLDVWESSVQADSLGFLWHNYHSISMAAANRLMGWMDAKQSDARRQRLAVLQKFKKMLRTHREDVERHGPNGIPARYAGGSGGTRGSFYSSLTSLFSPRSEPSRTPRERTSAMACVPEEDPSRKRSGFLSAGASPRDRPPTTPDARDQAAGFTTPLSTPRSNAGLSPGSSVCHSRARSEDTPSESPAKGRRRSKIGTMASSEPIASPSSETASPQHVTMSWMRRMEEDAESSQQSPGEGLQVPRLNLQTLSGNGKLAKSPTLPSPAPSPPGDVEMAGAGRLGLDDVLKSYEQAEAALSRSSSRNSVREMVSQLESGSNPGSRPASPDGRRRSSVLDGRTPFSGSNESEPNSDSSRIRSCSNDGTPSSMSSVVENTFRRSISAFSKRASSFFGGRTTPHQSPQMADDEDEDGPDVSVSLERFTKWFRSEMPPENDFIDDDDDSQRVSQRNSIDAEAEQKAAATEGAPSPHSNDGEEHWGFGKSLERELADQIWRKASVLAKQTIKDRKENYGWKLKLRPEELIPAFAHVLRSHDALHANEQDASIPPSWPHLREVIRTWPMPQGEHAGWCIHFAVCTQRYALKMLRTRLRIYLLMLVTGALGALCGVLHGADPSRNDVLIFYLLFNTMFGSICATSVIQSFVGDIHFLDHEAANGVSQTAEGLARLLIDVVVLAALVPVFTLPLYSLSSMREDLMLIWLCFAWSLSPLGYIFGLVAPGTATVLTTSVTLVICAFINGLFGLKRSALPPDAQWVMDWSPGYCVYLLLSFGSALKTPFGTKRWFIIRQLYWAKMVPLDEREEAVLEFECEGGASQYECDTAAFTWKWVAIRHLLILGLALRLITLIIFRFRSFLMIGNKTKLVWRQTMGNILLQVRKALPCLRGARQPEIPAEDSDQLKKQNRKRISRIPSKGGPAGKKMIASVVGEQSLDEDSVSVERALGSMRISYAHRISRMSLSRRPSSSQRTSTRSDPPSSGMLARLPSMAKKQDRGSLARGKASVERAGDVPMKLAANQSEAISLGINRPPLLEPTATGSGGSSTSSQAAGNEQPVTQSPYNSGRVGCRMRAQSTPVPFTNHFASSIGDLADGRRRGSMPSPSDKVHAADI